MKADLPINELLRIKALHDLAILDTPREQTFDDVAQVAMEVCKVPIAVVSLVDKNRQWFKSCLGLDATETPRDVAFCAHAILVPDEVLVVEDATKDPRFVDNALVTGPPYIRFYAGAPLVTDEGMALGTLCVIDKEPRSISIGQINSLKALARQVIQLLRLKATNEAIQQYATRVQLIADKVPVLIGELNLNREYTFANQKHKEWLNLSEQGCIGKHPSEIFPESSRQAVDEAIKNCMNGSSENVEVQLTTGRVLDINYLPQIENKKIVGVFEVATDVTERKIHLHILQQERERLGDIIKGTNVGTWEWNIPDNTVAINERWATMLGYSFKEVQPVTVDVWLDLLHPDDKDIAYQSVNDHLTGLREFHDCKFRMRKKNGEWLWVHAHGKVVGRNAEGAPVLVSGMHTDINDSKIYYDRLQEREDLLRSLLSNFPGVAYRSEHKTTWKMHYISDAVNQLTGYSAANFIGDGKMSFASLIHPEDVFHVNELVQQSLRDHRTFEIEYRIKRADGVVRTVQEFGRGIYSDANELIYIDGFIWDIQARIDSENEKQVMTHKLSQLFEMAPIGIMQVHESGRLIETNPEFSKIIGYTQNELKSMTFLDITPEEDWDRSRQAVSALQTNGRFGPVEKNYRSKSGELIPVEISGSLINLGEGSSQSWWTLVKDIREQKRMERMKSEFISTVSHELRTPLTSISGALGLITNSMLGALPEKAHNMLSIAYKNSQRLSYLINDLLDMEKLIAGKMFFDMKVQTVLPLVEQAIAENKSYADKYLVKIKLVDKVPNGRIKIDAFRLQQVFNNFLSNAAKYSPQNDEVRIAIENVDGWLRISVRDNGSGIPEEFKARMFQKFSQADSSDTRQKGGTGLGLAISKEIVERMGGKIGFESEVGKGTCFYADFRLEAQ